MCQIASWPGRITPGQTTNVPVTSTDFYPTFLELAGLPLHPLQHADGISLAGLLTESKAPDREAIFWHYPHYSNQGDTPACAIRSGDWKLIEHFEDPAQLELFNLREDIGETLNLAEQHPEKTQALHRRLVEWREEVKALIPEPNPNWIPQDRPENCDPPEV
jgi:arylsulfatase A-like enzyme